MQRIAALILASWLAAASAASAAAPRRAPPKPPRIPVASGRIAAARLAGAAPRTARPIHDLRAAAGALEPGRENAHGEALDRLYAGADGAGQKGVVQVGQSLIDTRAPGAPALIKALSLRRSEPPPVLGLFRPSNAGIVNAFAQGTEDVLGHSDLIAGYTAASMRDVAGYTFFLKRDGSYALLGSARLPGPIDATVERSLLRYLGITPARDSWPKRLWRSWLRVWDAITP